MSAYILDERGFDKLASELFAHATLERSVLNWTVKHVIGVDHRETSYDKVEAQIREFVRKLYAANVRAVNQRYEEATPPTILTFTNARGLNKWSNVQLLKNLECLSYQCAEGDVPNSEIYIKLEALIGGVARSIVGSLKDYDTAKWGWDSEVAA